jgi:carboxypeptidase PM20D1
MRIIKFLAAVLFVLVVVVAAKALLTSSHQIEVAALAPVAVDADAVTERLAGAVRIRTISSDDDEHAADAELARLHQYLENQFPEVHRVLKRESVAGLSLLYTWPGSDASAAPILLMAHQDVVPIAPGTEKDWTEPPYGGVRHEGFVWGRGSWDDKANLLGELEAVEALIKRGYVPRRTVYLAFGHDEETNGSGARAIVALLKSRQVKPEFVIDEGLLVTEGILPGVTAPVALVGVAEKGYLTVKLRTTSMGGHSSMPPTQSESAIAALSAALVRLNEHPYPAHIGGVAREMFDAVAPEMKAPLRVALTNLWLFEPLVRVQLEAAPSTNAAIRTTTALTVVSAGNKENVLPGVAEATVNFRMLPGDTIESVSADVKRIVGPGVEVVASPHGSNPSKVASITAPAYLLINRTVREVFPGTIVAPGLMIGATDSRYYDEICDNIYKFSPIRAEGVDLARFHGTNERISESNYVEVIRFYERLIEQGAALPATAAG